MKKIIRCCAILSVTLLSYSTALIAQIEIVNDGPLEIKNIVEWSGTYEVELHNLTNSIVLFDWNVYIPVELQPMILFEINDFNFSWAPDSYTNCGLDWPNELLPPGDGINDPLTPRFKIVSVVPIELEYLIDSIKLEVLSHPDCDVVYDSICFVRGDVLHTNDQNNPHFKVYPNPVNDIIYIENVQLSDDYQIFNSTGLVMQKGTIDNQHIDLEFQEKGLFVLKRYHKEEVSVVKFLKY